MNDKYFFNHKDYSTINCLTSEIIIPFEQNKRFFFCNFKSFLDNPLKIYFQINVPGQKEGKEGRKEKYILLKLQAKC